MTIIETIKFVTLCIISILIFILGYKSGKKHMFDIFEKGDNNDNK